MLMEKFDEFFSEFVALCNIELDKETYEEKRNAVATEIVHQLFNKIILSSSEIDSSTIPNDPAFFDFVTNKYFGGNKFSGDFSEYKMKDFSFYNVQFSQDSKLPKQRNFFRDNYVCGNMPVLDLNNYNTKNIKFYRIHFTPDSKLQSNEGFFQLLKDKKVDSSTLPTFNMNDYDMDGVVFSGCTFTKETVMHDDKDIFHKSFADNLRNTTLPEADYSDYSFDHVFLEETVFTQGTKLPLNILTQIAPHSDLSRVVWPLQAAEEIFLYNEPDKKINLRKTKIPRALLKLLHAKYKQNTNVLLPTLKGGA